MGNFRPSSRGGFSGRSSGNRSGGSRFGRRSDGNRSGGSRFGGRDSGRDRFGDRNSRRSAEMHEVTCDKCGKQCEVPFKPREDKPVYCSDCFRKNDGSGNSDSRNQNRSVQSGSSLELNQINAKLDRIIKILQELELDPGDDSEEESEDEESEEDEDLEDDEEDSDEDDEDEEESEDEEEEDESDKKAGI